MNENWISIYETTDIFQAEITKGFLIENEIDAVILNQRDSSYQAYGKIKIMVQIVNEKAAQDLIDQLNDSE